MGRDTRILLSVVIATLLSGCTNLSMSSVNCAPASQVDGMQPQKLYQRAGSKDLDFLSYEREVKPATDLDSSSRKVRFRPLVAIRALDGWLRGVNRGEWGGELTFLSRNGENQTLVEDNIVDIFQMPFGYTVFAGLTHGIPGGKGRIYVVSQPEAGRFIAKELHPLPGAPKSVQLLRSGDILIQTTNMEIASSRGPQLEDMSLVLGRDGLLQRVSCKSQNAS